MAKKVYLLLLSLLIILTGCTSPKADSGNQVELTISAAASMTDSLLELKEGFEHQYPNIKINYNFGGSGTLRKQIEQGAPIDIFFSASEQDYKLLDEAGFIKKGQAILQNHLVLIQPVNGELTSINDLLDSNGKIALGTPDAVPAGTYGKQSLENLGIWGDVQERLVYTKDVRQVLTFVKERSVDAGIVYVSDTLGEDHIEVVERIDDSTHDPIKYYFGIIDGNKHDDAKKKATENFYHFIIRDESMELFKKYGFDRVGD